MNTENMNSEDIIEFSIKYKSDIVGTNALVKAYIWLEELLGPDMPNFMLGATRSNLDLFSVKADKNRYRIVIDARIVNDSEHEYKDTDIKSRITIYSPYTFGSSMDEHSDIRDQSYSQALIDKLKEICTGEYRG